MVDFGVLDIVIRWGELFAAPIKDPYMLWIIIPIYLNWIVTEWYQEKKGTSLGNAITNGAVPLWVGIDWGKTTFLMLSTGVIGLGTLFVSKLIIIVFMIIYGLIIIVEGIRLRKITHFIGRIREVTFVCLVLTPVIYGAIAPDLVTLLAILTLFPIFYLVVELIDRFIPNPRTFEEDNMPSSGSSIPAADEFGAVSSEKFDTFGSGNMQNLGSISSLGKDAEMAKFGGKKW